MDKKTLYNAALTATVFLCLLMLWPNVVHEPLHWIAATVQGTDASIVFDWSLPAAPTTTRGPVDGVVGGLFFLTLPSLFEAFLLFITAAAIGGRLSIVSGRVSPFAYGLLLFLFIERMMGVLTFSTDPVNDWRFLVAVPYGWAIALLFAVAVLCATVFAFVRGGFLPNNNI